MRIAFLNKLTELMEQDDSIYVLVANTGCHVIDDFPNRLSQRYLNAGISEASMIGMASGLAVSGKKVFVYGIVPFVTMRCFEQIRVDLCYPELPVTIVGVGGGLTYGPAGMTHHSIEDIAVMNCLPNMTVICPGDPIETQQAVEAVMLLEGPCYLRLGKTGEKVVHSRTLKSFAIGKGLRVRKGNDVAIIATGNMLPTAVDTCDILEADGVGPELVSMHTIKPIDKELIIELARRCRLIATVEEHSIIGGLGSVVAGVLTEEELNTKVLLKKFAIGDEYTRKAGSQDYLRRQYGLTAETIADEVRVCLKKIR